jgi:hypothetical protein
VKFHGTRLSLAAEIDEYHPECETSVYALGQQELGHILSMPRVEAWRTSRRYTDQVQAALSVGIPFYSVHKMRNGQLWTSEHFPGSVY